MTSQSIKQIYNIYKLFFFSVFIPFQLFWLIPNQNTKILQQDYFYTKEQIEISAI